MNSEDQKKKLMQSLLKTLPKDPLLEGFAERLLQQMSFRTMTHLSTQNVHLFLQERYEFFKTNISKRPAIKISTPKSPPKWLKHRQMIEIVSPDASHLVITVEGILRKHGLRITRTLHPIIGITCKPQSKLTAIGAPEDHPVPISYTFIAFEEVNDAKLLSSIKTELLYHLKAVDASHTSQDQLFNLINTLQTEVKNNSIQSEDPKTEWIDLLDWLKKLNFSFFGYVPFDVTKTYRKCLKSKGIGILNPAFVKLNPEALTTLSQHTHDSSPQSIPFMFDSITVVSPVQRFENMMRLSIKLPKANGGYIEHTFLGILKRSSLYAKNIDTPLIRRKMNFIFDEKQLLPGSYDYNEIIRIFTSIPKFELFRSPKEDLLEMVDNLLSVTNPNHIQAFIKTTDKNRKAQVLMVMPNFIFTRETIQTTVSYFKNLVPTKSFEWIPVPAEEKCRLHIYIEKQNPADEFPNEIEIEKHLSLKIKTWEQDFKEHLIKLTPQENAVSLSKTYAQLIPDHYRVRTQPQDAAEDTVILENLSDQNPYQFDIKTFDYPPTSDLAGKASLLTVYSQRKINLIEIMPILQNLNLQVIDQLTSRIGNEDTTRGFIQSFRVLDQSHKKINEHEIKHILQELLTKIFTQDTANDPLNALVITAKLNWEEINILQMLRNYYCQLSPNHSREKVNQTLLKYNTIAQQLVSYFESRFMPNPKWGTPEKRAPKLTTIQNQIIDSLTTVDDIGEDTIIRRFINILENILRTNAYSKPDHAPFSIKINSKAIDAAPSPKPHCEIYVYHAHMEGVHLRFGTVARGGLRWSDRPDDFRTEILGLVKTQQTKNVVIVPVGSKGGFIVKESSNSREEAQANAKKHYKRFISALLDITDNMTTPTQVSPPKNVLRYDSDDPYLVVAADKGTATFSDIANGVSLDYGFWLGDAFASGGSHGYDHKKVGITARGAWECTELHFEEMGQPTESKPFTVAGVGDMSGDVFGNGMLLSKNIQLQAAFNHMHIFIDPNPDPQKSWKERARLFKKQGSSWTDYNSKLISPGGGVFNRKSKSIQLSKAMQKLLQTTETALPGDALIQLILKSPVDLMWFGGIGTYVKATHESHLDVGDQANNLVRINATEIQARIIGEGANLGFTQKARLEFAANGGRLNTDAIDNSAGVNMSDYEVNIKILLQTLITEGKIDSEKTRNTILEKATETVSDLVLSNNRGQHQLLSMDMLWAQSEPKRFAAFTSHLVENGLNMIDEDIPEACRIGDTIQPSFSRPVLAILQAYAKMELFEVLQTSTFINHPSLDTYLSNYFPKSIQQLFKDNHVTHRLRKEIISTVLTNNLINQSGMTAFFQLHQDTGQSLARIAEAYFIIDTIMPTQKKRSAIRKKHPELATQYTQWIDLEKTNQSICRKWLMGQSDNWLTLDSIDKIQKNFDNITQTYPALSSEETADILSMILSNKLSKPLSKPTIKSIIDQFNGCHLPYIEQCIQNAPNTSLWDQELRTQLFKSLFRLKQTLTQLSINHNPISLESDQLKSFFQLITEIKTHSTQETLPNCGVLLQTLESGLNA
jgi:glutamate dehydrogenase